MRLIHNPDPAELGDTPHAFLDWLRGPAAIRITGTDSSRARAVVALVHGNEPSGLIAVHDWLRGGARPAVDALILVAAVDAARRAPGFAHRMLPGHRDLNRCFRSPFSGDDGALAAAILGALQDTRLEAAVDLHNTTGANAAYGITPSVDTAHLNLAALFTDRCVHSRIRLGTLTEALADAAYPSVAIECGNAGNHQANEVARRGVDRLLTVDRLDRTPAVRHPIRLYSDPVRVRIAEGVFLAYGHEPDDRADLTLLADVDRFDFERVAGGSLIGWVGPGSEWPLRAFDESGTEVSRDWFEVEHGSLRLRRAAVPMMMTTDPATAALDCLFYLVGNEELAALDELLVRQLMTDDVVTLFEEQTLPLANDIMKLRHIRHLPVIDDHRRLVGLVTHRDVIAAHDADIQVAEMMNRDLWTVHPSTTALRAAELLRDHRFGCLPVVDDDGRLVGIITEADFLGFAIHELSAR